MRLLARVAAALVMLLALILGGAAIAMRAGLGRTTPTVIIEPGLVGEVASGVWLYAASAGDEVLLFDAGLDPRGRPIEAALRALDPAHHPRVADVFLTHGHTDHTGGAGSLPGARVHAGRDDVELAAGREKAPGALGVVAGLLMPRAPAVVTDPLRGDARVALGGRRGEVLALPIPGHTRGSTAFLWKGVLFLGDAATLKDGELAPGPRFFSADSDANDRSVAGLAGRLAGMQVRRICTGHGGCSADGPARGLLERFAAGAR